LTYSYETLILSGVVRTSLRSDHLQTPYLLLVLLIRSK